MLALMRKNDRALNTPVVGFSGVLFCWSTVSALRSSSTSCSFDNIFGVPNTFTFQTYHVGPVAFNFSPFFQLLAIQFCIPSVSFFEGHLAGIIFGCAIQWGVFPLCLMQPSLLVPVLLLWCHWHISGSIPVQHEAKMSLMGDDSTIVLQWSTVKYSGACLTFTRFVCSAFRKARPLLCIGRCLYSWQ